ncbi:hypothetical protein AVEN_183835-1 [Araneus ventricosus]|uniref:Fibronectin type-III domain-containing protein n=2 Tax=Araneus ventricosus TaxID=182803 RepID=A0A4Y2WM72_ARAVE|nr:hypothetical protein AVEN_69982-1 [Araneus ventricosus]GBO37051.1 hypothetical protein AVEN_107215-1 [Araneus ventricosus]GBO37057.1 hypothetical protein AVEN_183835-1 [Araneus ventricosus]
MYCKSINSNKYCDNLHKTNEANTSHYTCDWDLPILVPAPPEFSVWSDEPGILIIKFGIPPISILPILEYRIEWKLTTDTDWHQARYHQASDGNEFVIHGLSFESDYSIRIAARNTVGYSNYSEEVVQRTKGLIAETVVDGSSVSSSFNSAVASALMADIFQHYVSILVLYLIIVFKYR